MSFIMDFAVLILYSLDQEDLDTTTHLPQDDVGCALAHWHCIFLFCVGVQTNKLLFIQKNTHRYLPVLPPFLDKGCMWLS